MREKVSETKIKVKQDQTLVWMLAYTSNTAFAICCLRQWKRNKNTGCSCFQWSITI